VTTNLTITVDEEILKRARIRALESGTSVNALLAEHLARIADSGAAPAAIRAFLALGTSEGDRARAAARGRRPWTREDLHARR
jgi:hypothetical protein